MIRSGPLLTIRFALLGLMRVVVDAVAGDVVLLALVHLVEAPRRYQPDDLQHGHHDGHRGDAQPYDLGVHGRHLDAAEPLVGLLVGDLAYSVGPVFARRVRVVRVVGVVVLVVRVVAVRVVVVVEVEVVDVAGVAAGDGQVVPEALVVAGVVGAAAAQLPLYDAERLRGSDVVLYVVVPVVDRVLDELVRVLAVHEDEHQGGGDRVSDDDDDQEDDMHGDEPAAVLGGAEPAAHGHEQHHEAEDYEEPRRDLQPIDAVVEQVVVAVAQVRELRHLHEEPYGRGGQPEADQRIQHIHYVYHILQ